jgi:hypothetical protein
MTSNCEIEMTGPEKAYVKATATYLLRNETKSRPVSGYMSSGRTKDNIAGCDAVIEVVVDRFIP